MEIIKLGDRLLVPGKNVKGEVAYIGKTHFGGGTWFGLILDDAIGKHNGVVENKRYFKCSKNHGMFIKASYFEKRRGDINKAIEKRCCLSPKKINYLNYSNGGYMLKTEKALREPKHHTQRKREAETQNKRNPHVGDKVTSINVKNTPLTKVSERGDNHSEFGENVFKFVRRYPNYLKASSHITGTHFCLNKCKTEEFDDPAARISNRYLISPIREKRITFENETPKKVTYPNYLKSSAKLVRKHFCIENVSVVNYDRIKNTFDKTEEMQSSNLFSNTKDTYEKPYAYLIRYPYQPRTLSKFKEKHSCQEKRRKIITSKSIPENEQIEIMKDNYMKYIRDLKLELEEVKCEYEQVKVTLQSTEATLNDTVKKYNAAKKENKYLKLENECQKKTIKCQKSHLKLLSLVQGNSIKKPDLDQESLKQKEISYICENTEQRNDINISEEKTELESNKHTPSLKHVQELEQQNRLMVQGLNDIRHFLQTQCKSQCIEPKPVTFDSHARFINKHNAQQTFSKSFNSTARQTAEISAAEKSETKPREYLEILRDITKNNELTKTKRENVTDWGAINLSKDTHLIQKFDFHDINHPGYMPVQQSLCASKFDQNNKNYSNPNVKINLDPFQSTSTLIKEDNSMHKNYDLSFDLHSHLSQCVTKMNGNIDHNLTHNASFKSANCITSQNNKMLTKDLFYDGEFSFSNAALIEEEIPKCIKRSDSRVLEGCSGYSTNSPCMTESSDFSPVMFK